MPFTAESHIRIARPSRDLVRAERFWVQGLGLSPLYRKRTEEGHELLMVGLPGASWHLELVTAPEQVAPRPTDEDLLVIYLDDRVPEELLARLEEHGGHRVPSPNPYWNEWGTTVEDPDGYRLVLCRRGWSNA
ncbi:VOC family protein [Streptomyces sp. ODS28]|uniref:VOC family protein n=1 Tax=Streptomyces sp. ODS28 TaxID=3136688 RepID=UPI0031F0B101